jgi:multiple sugar transport system permease protein
MTAATDTKDKAATPQVTDKWRRRGLQTFLFVTAMVWLLPLLWAVYTSLRPFSETAERGYVSIGGTYNFDNYTQAWTDAEMLKFFINTMWITIPGVILTLFFASMAGFALSRFSFRFNLLLLMVFTAGNLLPQQVIITPLYRMFLALPLPDFLSPSGVFYDSYFGIITIHVAFQMGFATFVLSNYMKALPGDLNEAAFVDGASVWRQYWNIILPLTRPPLAALAVLMFTWIYNDFFWALVLMVTGDQRPITSALQNLSGTFFVNNNLIAAGSLLAAIPTLIVFAVLQRQFVAGLTLGSTKG